MDFQQLLIAQIPLFLLSIGYFFKRVFDLKSKKIEVKYSLFQSKKIEAITKFIDNYYEAEKMWKHFSIHRVIDRQINTAQLDGSVTTVLDQVNSSLIELTIYLNEKDKLPFEAILRSLQTINGAVMKIYSNSIPGDSIEKANFYHEYQNNSKKVCREQLNIIGENTRKYYYSV